MELLGNHTDYNRGLVLSAAIDRYTCVAAARCPSLGEVRVWSENLAAADRFPLEGIAALPRGSWSNYVRGVGAALVEAGDSPGGFDAAIVSEVPLGGGLSSSASLECAVAMAVLALAGHPFDQQSDGMKLAERLRAAEHEFAGVQCGVLDQFSCVFGKKDHALFLDCDALAHETVSFGSLTPAIVVCDSRTPHELARGKYNERRTECDDAVDSLRRRYSATIGSLRDVPYESFLACQVGMKSVLARRARHVLTENQRVQAGVELLRRSGDLHAFGQLMLESHQSSRDNFENSSPELDCLVEIARSLPGFRGAKLSGAGWGGCTVNLVHPAQAEFFARRLVEEFSARVGLPASALLCNPAPGARAVRA